MIRALRAMVAVILTVGSAPSAELEAGAAKADITPPTGFPMWGYAARHDKPSVGVLDPLFARALVVWRAEAGSGGVQTRKTPGFPGVLASFDFNSAERAGFEPAVGFYPHAAL